ncbi:D-alanyl-D-alanine carboxypeptidase family protein [Bacillus cereus]|uniref:D-alanyl-D-alanine carboxypeptidase family protein n=1 Tax=Bacillus cereus TaxID=1396 RepID=UPI00159616B4|nr:D-alanyl-D-alanine carboxypeptidase family protein [Bacillus cereus]
MNKWLATFLAAGVVLQGGVHTVGAETTDNVTIEKVKEIDNEKDKDSVKEKNEDKEKQEGKVSADEKQSTKSKSLEKAIEPTKKDQVEPEPQIQGQFAVALDKNTKKIIFEKNADEKAYPASITKIITAILLDENLKKTDKITFSEEAVKQEPSNQQLLYKKGEEISANDALESLMIISSNDVAYAVAEKIGGSVEKFADMMNKKAKELGATNTHFVSPNGLHNENHYTTAHDMALFTAEAVKHPNILEKMGQREAEIKTNERVVKIKSPNDIPHKNQNAVGGKTGYTNAAQHTLTEYQKSGDKEVITVTMHTTKEGKYDDMNKMSEYAFKKIKTKKLYDKGDVIQVFEMNDEEIPAILKENAVIPSDINPKKLVSEIEFSTEKKEFKKGDTIGWLIIKNDKKEELGKFDIETNKTFKPNAIMKKKKSLANDSFSASSPAFPTNSESSYAWTIGLIFSIPVITFLVLHLFTNLKRRKYGN